MPFSLQVFAVPPLCPAGINFLGAPPNDAKELFEPDRFEEEFLRAQSHRLDRRLQLFLAGEQDKCETVATLFLDPREKLETVHAGHVDVGQKDRNSRVAAKNLEGLVAAGRRPAGKTLVGQELAKFIADFFFVVDDQYCMPFCFIATG